MITEHDLLEAIAECQGAKAPNANTCIKLAAYYTILDNIRGDEPVYSGISRSSSPMVYDGDSEFANLIKGRDYTEIIPIIDELMTTLSVINPRLYNGVMSKLQ